MLCVFLSACNNDAGGGVGDASLSFMRDATPLSDASPLPGAGTQGHTVTGFTATVSDATISVVDSDGAQLLYEYGNERAGYSVTLPVGSAYPVLVTASNGVDLVTGVPPAITMMSVVESPAETTANLNPLTTLIVKTALAMPGGLTGANLQLANQYVVTSLSFGMDSVLIPQPINTMVDGSNVASLVKAGVVLTETLRRGVNRLSFSGIAMSEDELLDALAADLVDGRTDGMGAGGADPLLTSLTMVVLAQVMLESIGNTLQIDGLPVIAEMDKAIAAMFPNAQASVADTAVSGETLDHLRLLIHAAQPVTASDDSDLAAILAAINALDADMSPGDIAPMLPLTGGAAFDPAIGALLASVDGSAYQAVLGAFSETHQHRLLALAWLPSDEVDGYIVHAGPTATTATAKVTVVTSPSVELDTQIDLGLSPGDNVCFRIKAFNTSGTSPFSGAVCTTI